MLKSFKFLFLASILLGSLFLGPVTPAKAAAIPAEINKQFTPIVISSGGVSVLRITIFNPNTFPLTNASFVDNLLRVQPGLFISTPAGVVNTCGGSVTAPTGGTTITLVGGGVPAQTGSTPGECFIEINISSTTPGNLINTIPAHNPAVGDVGLTASGNDNGNLVTISNTTPASATLTVVGVQPPTVTKAFAPNTVWVGQPSTLSITVNNNDAAVNLTQTSFTDTLPAGVVVANPANITTTNCGAPTVLAPVGGSSVALSGATVTPNLNCVVSVQVVSSTAGSYTNTIPAGPNVPGSIVTQQGVTNPNPATAVLNVQPMRLSKAFSPAAIAAGGTSTLTILLENPTGSNYTGVNLTDALPTGLTIVGTPATPQCGGAITSTATSVTLTGGTIPASATPPTPVGSCTITVTVTAPANAPTATLTNTIPPNSLVTAQGVTNPAAVTADLNVQSALTGTKSYSPTTIATGGVSTVTITLENRTSNALTGVLFTDALPANLTISGSPAVSQCGGTVTNTATAITLTGGVIPPSATPPTPPGTCTITFQVTSLVVGSGTTYENTIPAGDITTAQGIVNTAAVTTGTDLTVVPVGGPVGLTKAFQTNPISLGQPSRLRITITAPIDSPLSNASYIDNLPTGLVVSSPPATAPNTSCAGASINAVAGSSTIGLTGINLAAGASCRLDVRVTSNTPATYVNNIPPGAVSSNEGRTNVDPATSTINVTSLTTSKSFTPDSVAPNGESRLRLTLTNSSDLPLTNVSVTDDLTTMGGTPPVSGVVIASIPNASTTCGGTLTTVAGTRLITLVNGTIPPRIANIDGICVIEVDVMAIGRLTTRTNTLPIANVSGVVGTSGVVINPIGNATASLTIADLGIGIVKGFDPVLVYGGAASTMTVQLINPNNTTLTGITFTDNMVDAVNGPGIILANPPSFNVGTCGGTMTGNPGDSSFTFSGGVLPGNTSCMLTLKVVMSVNGNRTNRIPAGAVTTINGATNADPTEASLTNLPGLSIAKVFNPDTILVGGTSVLTITITNTSNIPVVNMQLNDNLPGNLPAGVTVSNPPNANHTCDNAANPNTPVLTAVAGAQSVGLTGGYLPGNGTCSINVNVTSSVAGVYINTIPSNAITSDGGITNNNPATATLTVNSTGFSLGNRIWFDTDNSATINGSESGIDGVDVVLYAADVNGNPTGLALASTTTSNGGYYRFDNLPAGDYVAVIPSSEFAQGGTLNGYWSSGTTMGANGTVTEVTAPDADNDVDSDDNGTRQTTGAFSGGVISSAVTLGPTASEPTNDTDANPANPPGEAPNDQSNRTVDFGFYRLELGDQIFVDANNNGVFDAGDSPLAGARVQIFSSNGTEINVGPDGILGTSDDAPSGVLTPADGTYLFSGLPQGDYIVRVTPPSGYTSTVDTFNSGDTTNPNANINDNDNGIGTGPGQVSSNIVTLTPGSLGAASNNVVVNATGTTTNPTVDFGFVAPSGFSLGNRVWFDTDNSSTINGSEVGVNSVAVNLYAADVNGNPTGSVLATTTTANGGYYRFDGLSAGDYVVVLPSSNFGNGGALKGYWSSGTSILGNGSVTESAAPGPNNDVDGDDNGMLQTAGAFNGAVVSGPVTLGPNPTEPTNDTDANPSNPPGEAVNNQSNRTVDFGFYRVEIGDQIFIDNNSDGMYDSINDSPLPSAVVQIYTSGGTEVNVGPDGVLGTADDAPGGVTTGPSGDYLFSGLPQGSYIIRVTPPAGYVSTVDVNADTTTPNNDVNHNDNGVGVLGGQVSSNTVTLTPGVAGASTTVSNATGSTHNPSMDFGFVVDGSFAKTIEGTDQSFTSGTDVAVGEIVTYRVAFDISAGTVMNNVVITDRMDKGLAFVDCLEVSVDGNDLTASVCPPTVSSIQDLGDPANHPANPGRQVIFNVGNIPAPVADTTLVIRYRVIVLDVIENQNSVTLNNRANISWDGGQINTSAPNVRIVEPDLAVDKSVTPSQNVPIGTPVQFTLTISHTGQSTADAFDVVVADAVPATLQYIPCTIQFSGVAPTSPTAPAFCPGATSNLTFTWDNFPLGSTATITFNAYLVGSPAVNFASVAWTSLPIDPVNGVPVPLSSHNPTSTERWYDPNDAVNVYSVSDSASINAPDAGGGGGGGRDTEPETSLVGSGFLIPVTGFTPNVVTTLPEQPASSAYSSTDVWLEIPSLGVNMPVVGVPRTKEGWDVSWLWSEAGWLAGSAFPGWDGNSVLTSHVTLPNGKAGPFSALGTLKWGNKIIIHAYGISYVYEVRQNRTVTPYDSSVFKHENESWLTLITCKNYNETTDTYTNRVAVRAVLINTREDAGPKKSSGIR